MARVGALTAAVTRHWLHLFDHDRHDNNAAETILIGGRMRRMSITSMKHLLIGVTVAALATGVFAADLWVYSDRDFTGSFARLSRSERNLPTGAARSIRVASGVWEVCTGANFTGNCQRLTTGDYRDLGGRYGEAILSVRDITYNQDAVGYTAPRLQLFEGRQFRGRTLAVEQNVGDLGRAGFDDRASSAIVSGGTWEVCTEYNFRGRCQALPPGQYPDLGAQLENRILSARAIEAGRGAPPAVATGPARPYQLGDRDPEPVVAQPLPPLEPQPSIVPAYDRSRVEVFTAPNFGGVAMTIDADVYTLRNTGFNDEIQSMRVFGGNWEACENKDFGGNCMVFGPGDYRRLPPQMDRSITSLRQLTREPSWTGLIPSGATYQMLAPNAPRSRHPIWLYEHSNFQGSTLRAIGDVPNLGNSGMNDRTSSMFISWGTWQLCEHANYGGRCFTAGPGQYPEMPAGMNDSISSIRRVR
jgi:Beta/Gamma crystallin